MPWHIFTRGPLFEAVQALRLFPDSKKFPDMIPRGSGINAQLENILARFIEKWNKHLSDSVIKFTQTLASSGKKPAAELIESVAGFGNGVIAFRSELYNLINEYFQDRPEPAAMLNQSVLRTMSSMEAYIDSIWPILRRDIRNLPDWEGKDTTLIPLKYPYVVAGFGRFNEVYYWDAYFTGEGLVLSGYLDLFDCMVENYARQIDEYKYVPNGNRQYYLGRSQAPFYCSMIDLLARMKGIDFLKGNPIKFQVKGESGNEETKSIGYINMVEEEYKFWMAEKKDPRGEDAKTKSALKWWGRAVKLKDKSRKDIVLNKYWDDTYDEDFEPHVQPRPEAYYEDISEFARTQYNPEEASDFFLHIRATAESGWDFSSRWFRLASEREGEPAKRERATIRTGNILPVDLNALLFGMEKNLSEWTDKPDKPDKPDKKDCYKKKSAQRKEAIINYFWNEELGWFFDYWLGDGNKGQPGQTDVWSLAGAYPLFTKLFDDENEEDMKKVKKMADTICKRFLKAGGVVTTLHVTSEQWDYPNGWAPLQWIVVRGLLNYSKKDPNLKELAWEITKRFVACVGKTYKSTGRIMEKYNVCETAVIACGGEYEVQHGFGWTNGVIKAFMSEFRSKLENDSELSKYLE